MNEHFNECVIVLDCTAHTESVMDLPPYSPDMIFLSDVFLWGHVQDQMYRHILETIQQLEQYICSACEAIPSETLTWVSAHFV